MCPTKCGQAATHAAGGFSSSMRATRGEDTSAEQFRPLVCACDATNASGGRGDAQPLPIAAQHGAVDVGAAEARRGGSGEGEQRGVVARLWKAAVLVARRVPRWGLCEDLGQARLPRHGDRRVVVRCVCLLRFATASP